MGEPLGRSDHQFGDRGTIAISGRGSIGTTASGDRFAVRGFNAQPVVAWFFADDVSLAIGGIIGWTS